MSTLSNNLLFLVGRKKVLRFPAKKIPHSIICGRLYGFETHCAHLLYLYVGDDSNFGMFRSTLDYYSRLVITNILLSFRFRLRYAMFKFSETLQISWFPSHILSGQFLSPSLICRSSIITPYPKTQMPQTHTDTWFPSLRAIWWNLCVCPTNRVDILFLSSPYLFNLSCCIYKGSFIWWMKKICGRKITYICWI